jgi:hypothetical protein
MYRQQLSKKTSPLIRSTPISQEIASSQSYGSLSSVVQKVQQDPNSVSEDERQQLESAIGSRSTKEILAGKQTQWTPEFQGISARIWGNERQVTAPIQPKGKDDTGMSEVQPENKTGLPDNLKTGIENLSGMAMDDVRVHYNSSKPADLQALAYTQGTDIHVAPGQENHLPHEIWHVVQQKQGRVKPTIQMEGVGINDDQGLEKEADIMGAKAFANATPLQGSSVVLAQLKLAPQTAKLLPQLQAVPTVQRVKKTKDGVKYAENEKEAQTLMEAYAKKQDVKPSAEEMSAAISAAMNKELGIDQGERIILQTKLDIQEAKARKARLDAHQEDYNALLDYLTEDSLAYSALNAAFARYVNNPSQPNLTLGSTYTQDEVNDALQEWKSLQGSREGVKFWGYPGQDKAKLGKGNVGNTLDTRKVQANFLCQWGGSEINVHINISG